MARRWRGHCGVCGLVTTVGTRVVEVVRVLEPVHGTAIYRWRSRVYGDGWAATAYRDSEAAARDDGVARARDPRPDAQIVAARESGAEYV